MKELRAVEVRWVDAHGGANEDWSQLDKRTVHKPERIRTVGLVKWEDEDGMTLLLSHDTRGNSDAYIFIPAASIVTVKELS